MPVVLTDGLGFVAVVLAYWILDILIRRDATGRLLKRGSLVTVFWVAVTLALATKFRWAHIPHAHAIMPLALGLSLLLAWKVTTKDIDPVIGDRHVYSRPGMIAAAVGVYFTPACLPLVLHLLTQYFDRWRHHAILPMRSLLATTAYVLVAGLSTAVFGYERYVDVHVAIALVLVIHISHYLTAGTAKMDLGPKWYSWFLDNRLHYMVASAYSWGWARFLPWGIWLKLIRAIKWAERPLQATVFFIEIAAPLALLGPRIAIGFCVVWSVFHVGVLFFSGIWFWEWVGANAMLAWAVWLMPQSLSDSFFGWHAVVLGTIFILLFPVRNRLWGPTSLGWWDTPVTQRMHWVVEGQSGKTYELYGKFMCPHERLYAKVHGCFLAPVPIIAFHNGAVYRCDHRDAIHQAGADPARLDDVRARFGTLPRNAKYAENHIAYLHRFLHAINHGARKSVLPRWLRWLKSPGGHLHYWGDLPAFQGQEPAVKCTLHFREQYFDGSSLVRLRNDTVAELVIDEDSGKHVCGPEPKAREMEHFLVRALWAVNEPKPNAAEERLRPYA